MWSGETACSQPPQRAHAVHVHDVRADALDRRAHLVEHAREVLHVRLGGGVADHGRAGRQRGGHQRVLGAHHGRLVHEEVGRAQPAVGRAHADVAVVLDLGAERAEGVEVRVEAAAADDVAARAAASARSRSAPAAGRRPGRRRGCARPAPGRRRCVGMSAAVQRDRVVARAARRSTPRSASSASIASVSRMRGTLAISTRSSVRRLAASSGRAAFLFPAAWMVPESGTPPSMTSFSMVERRARVTPMSQPLSREDAWSLFCEWTESASLRKHVLAVEAAMRAYAPRFGGDEEEWGLVGMLHDLDYERHPDMTPRTATRGRAWPSSSARASRPSSCARSPRTRTSSRSRATPTWRRRCTRSTSSPASSWPAPTSGPRASTG